MLSGEIAHSVSSIERKTVAVVLKESGLQQHNLKPKKNGGKAPIKVFYYY
jgi:hypothetical protein